VQQQAQKSGAEGSSSSGRVGFRQLLWDVLHQLKPAACRWYEHGARHHQQQQAKAAGKGAQGAAVEVSVPHCTSTDLWTTLCHSLASDLLLVPPSIRDLISNGWAAGAGRLGPCAPSGSQAGSSSTPCQAGSSSTPCQTGRSDTAAVPGAQQATRMLVAQYARAVRQQFAQV